MAAYWGTGACAQGCDKDIPSFSRDGWPKMIALGWRGLTKSHRGRASGQGNSGASGSKENYQVSGIDAYVIHLKKHHNGIRQTHHRRRTTSSSQTRLSAASERMDRQRYSDQASKSAAFT